MKNYQTTREIADSLDLTPQRVVQIVGELGLEPEQVGSVFLFTKEQVQQIANRPTKPGPKKAAKESK